MKYNLLMDKVCVYFNKYDGDCLAGFSNPYDDCKNYTNKIEMGDKIMGYDDFKELKIEYKVDKINGLTTVCRFNNGYSHIGVDDSCWIF